jgi:hypothetical protein
MCILNKTKLFVCRCHSYPETGDIVVTNGKCICKTVNRVNNKKILKAMYSLEE